MPLHDADRLGQHQAVPGSGRQYGWLAQQPWLSFQTAARLTGLTMTAIEQGVAAGQIHQRTVPEVEWRPASLERESVLAWACQHRTQLKRRERGKKRLAILAAGRGLPPNDDDVWLDTGTVGLMLGISERRVRQLAQRERVPCVSRDQRLWFRRDLTEFTPLRG